MRGQPTAVMALVEDFESKAFVCSARAWGFTYAPGLFGQRNALRGRSARSLALATAVLHPPARLCHWCQCRSACVDGVDRACVCNCSPPPQLPPCTYTAPALLEPRSRASMRCKLHAHMCTHMCTCMHAHVHTCMHAHVHTRTIPRCCSCHCTRAALPHAPSYRAHILTHTDIHTSAHATLMPGRSAGPSAATIKVIVVGNGGVGKSSMIRRFCTGEYTDTYKKTIGVDFLEKEKYIDR